MAQVYQRLEEIPGKIEKSIIISNELQDAPHDLLDILPMLLMGKIFPDWMARETGIGPGLLYDAVKFVTGNSNGQIKDTIKEEGDIGKAAEKLFESKVQTSLFSRKLTVRQVHQTFRKISELSGSKAQGKKIKLLVELFNSASPLEAKYLSRTLLGELRIGVAEGLVRDAISKAYNVDPRAVERAYMLTNDFGKVALVSKDAGERGLSELKMKVGIPIKPMLAQIAPSIKKVLKDLKTAEFEIKYDGARVQIHKNDNEIKIFSRRLEDVTDALPDVVERAMENIKSSDVIIEGECVAVDPATRKVQPFQAILKRFRRKYHIRKMIEEIPLEVHIFDILYFEGKTQIDTPFKERRKILEEIITSLDSEFHLAEKRITGNLIEAEDFYKKALELGHEGVMIKNLDAPYIPGARVGYMYKIKPIKETLDLVITGALWGKGKRAGWLSSYYLGARDEMTGEFLQVGRVASGLTDVQLEEFTNLLKPLITKDSQGKTKIKPLIVVEVAFQEVQKSPKYDSGFALRFPRVVQIRGDKGPGDTDILERIKEML